VHLVGFIKRKYSEDGPKYENGERQSRTNRDLEEMSKGENTVKWIKGQTLSWLGHLAGMEEDRMPKKIVAKETEGTRRRGRPRKGWKEEVKRDLQVLGVRRWRELVMDTKKMEGYCSAGQSPQLDVVPMEEEGGGGGGKKKKKKKKKLALL